MTLFTNHAHCFLLNDVIHRYVTNCALVLMMSEPNNHMGRSHFRFHFRLHRTGSELAAEV